MTNKERYTEWVAQQEYVPISMMPWWLDAVCAGQEWDALLAEDEEGNIVGAMPFLLRKRAWFRFITMPPMSQTGGIWVTAEVTADRWKTAEVCRQIAEQLNAMKLTYYYQQYLPGSLCVDAMRALGFKTKERATYRMQDLSDLDKVINSFSRNKRRLLQKALSLNAVRNMDIEDFIRFYERCQKTRKRHVSYSREFLLVLERKARRLKQCEIISVNNIDGQPYAAAFVIWDKTYMHFLLPTYDPAFADSGASALLVLEAMKSARERHLHFDFGNTFDSREAKQFNAESIKFFSVERSYKAFPAFIIRCAEHFT